jgi:hypothetical protein
VQRVVQQQMLQRPLTVVAVKYLKIRLLAAQMLRQQRHAAAPQQEAPNEGEHLTM